MARTPETMTMPEAAAVPLAALTALQALRDKAELSANMRVMINGASGGVGTFAVQIAKVMGAAHIVAVCSARNAELVQQLGADTVIDYQQTDIQKMHLNDNERFDIVFDTVNNLKWSAGRTLLKGGGILVTVNPGMAVPPLTWLARIGGWQLRSVFVQPNGADLEMLTQWANAGQLCAVIERTFPLEQAADAHRLSETLRVRGKLVIVVNAT